MPDDDPLGSSVTLADPADGWRAYPVDHDPFAEGSSGNPNRDFGAQRSRANSADLIAPNPAGENPPPSQQPSSVRIAGHLAASPDPGQVYTPKYLAARPQGSISSYDPSLSEKIQQGVSETAQRAGVPVQGAERMGSTVQGAAEMAPGLGNILAGNEAARSWQSGDPWGTLMHGAMALPIPGASAEEGAARRISPLGLYSHGADVAANLPQKVGTTQQMVAALKAAGVKPVEMQAAGVQKLADTAPTLFPEKMQSSALENMFHQASPQLQETVLGQAADPQWLSQERQRLSQEGWSDETLDRYLEGEIKPTKFEQWVLPGPQENYREVLLHTPEQQRTFAVHRGGNQIGPGFSSAQEARDWGRTQGEYPNPDLSVRETTPPDQPAPFTDSHWDTPNVVAHLRFSDRTSPGSDLNDVRARMANAIGVPPDQLGSGAAAAAVKKGAITPQEAASFSRENGWLNKFLDQPGTEQKHLHLEELQSDWGQKGRDEGFTRPLTPEEQELQAMYQKDPNERPTYDWHRAAELEQAGVGRSLREATEETAGKHPIGPYVTNTQDWTDLGLKRALVEAARGDYTHLSWATGNAQADRYKLSRHYSDLSYNPETGSLQGRVVGGGRGIDERNVTPDKLANFVGPEVAQRMLETPRGPHFSAVDDRKTAAWQRSGWHTLSGENLDIGGQGMRSYYDPVVLNNEGQRMVNKDGSLKVGVLPTQLSKLVKKLDPSAKIGQSQLEGSPKPVLPRYAAQQTKQNTVHSIPITPMMREKILKGLPQYKRGGRVGFAEGGGLDDDTPPDVASDATEERLDAQRIPAVAQRGIPVEGDWPGQGDRGQVGPGYPASPSEGQPGGYLGSSGVGGVRPSEGGGQSPIFAPAQSDAFHQAISEAKAAHKYGAAVTLYSPEEYAQMQPFLSQDRKTGFALKGDDIVSVFRHPQGQIGAQQALKMAVELGGRRLDAFDTTLPRFYSEAGFKPVSRLPFDEQYAPEGWDYETFKNFNGGRPDVVHMVHDPENRSHIGGKPVVSYDEGVAAQDEALKEIGGRPLMAPQLVGHPGHKLQDPYSEPPVGRPVEWTGGRTGFAHGGAPEDPLGSSVTYSHPQLEPVEHDPFPPEPAVQPSDIARAKGFPEPRSPMHDRIAAASHEPPRLTGHVAAEQVPGQVLTPKYLEAKPQGTLSPGDPSVAEQLQQGVSEGAQRLGVPVQGAERIGQTVRTGAEYAPGTSNVLSAADAYQAGQRGDYLGATLSALGAVPIPGAGTVERAGVGAIERGADGILRHTDPAFEGGRIATTTPWSKKLPDAHQSGGGTIGHDTMQASTDAYPKTSDIIKEMPYTGVKEGKGKAAKTTWTPTSDLNIPADATPEEAHEALIDHAKSNILALHDAVPEDIRNGSMQWYDGANTIAKQRAQQYDRPLENIAGVYAALSPQMDWYKNASLGDRVMDILHTKSNMPFSPEMQAWTDSYLKGSSSSDTAISQAIFDKIKDKPLGQITEPLERAHWIRAYDEAHNSRAYNLVNPDGSFGDTVKKGDGTEAGAGWGSMPMIANAVKAFDAKDMPTISRTMGAGHKVRNFYNNILDPNARTGDVTIDTHAIAAALMRPLSGSDKDTTIGLGQGGPGSAMTGAQGLYGAYAAAYRRAAEERGILPRQMQSITWEAIRGLYSPAEKRNASFRKAVNDAWARHGSGEWTQQQVQQHLMTNPETGASRIRPPSWYSGAPEVED